MSLENEGCCEPASIWKQASGKSQFGSEANSEGEWEERLLLLSSESRGEDSLQQSEEMLLADSKAAS